MSQRTLEQALKEVLQDDNKISKYEARVLRELILADRIVSAEEKKALEAALDSNSFDEDAYRLLANFLLRADARM